jgi:Tol biopolymer transport system component
VELSSDGRFVAFSSRASNLVRGDTNSREDVFVRDRRLGTTERTSVSSTESQGNNPSDDPGISADGRFVVFCSDAWDLTPRDTNDTFELFVRNLATGITRRVSVSSTEQETDGPDSGSYQPKISSSGTGSSAPLDG